MALRMKRPLLLIIAVVVMVLSSAGVVWALDEARFDCKIPKFNVHFCSPAFDLGSNRNVYVYQGDTDPETRMEYALFNMTSTGCNGTMISSEWRKNVQDGESRFLASVNRDWDRVCVKVDNPRVFGEGSVRVTGEYRSFAD